MAENTLSYPLFQVPPIDNRTGQWSRPWQQWLTALWRRVGQAEAPSLDDLAMVVEAEYLVATANATLANERTVVNTATLLWDFSVVGQAKANVSQEAIEDIVGAMLVDTSTIDFTYNDGASQISAIIPDNGVTYVKMQAFTAASKLLGRGDSGAGNAQEITVGTGLAMTGTTLSATGTVLRQALVPLMSGFLDTPGPLPLVYTEGSTSNFIFTDDGMVVMAEVTW